MKYRVEVKEELSRIIEVEADNENEAIAKAEKMYLDEEIVLDSSDISLPTEITIAKNYD